MKLVRVHDAGCKAKAKKYANLKRKAQAKKYADLKRKAKPSCINIGDEVLVKRDHLQHQTDTLSYPDV